MTAFALADWKILSSITAHDQYGLAILAEVHERGTRLSLGSLYAALNRLEREGLLESYWGEATPERGGHRRRYYKITAQGALAVTEHQMSFANSWNWALAYTF